MEFNPKLPLFQPTEIQERSNSRKRAREACTCPVCTKHKTHRTVKTQTYESSIYRRNQDPKPDTACLFKTHHQVCGDLSDTFVCCNLPTTQDRLLQVHRLHLGAHRLAIIHTPHETHDPRVAAVIPLAIIRGHHGPPPVQWSELSLALVPAGTLTDPEYTAQCFECTTNPDCPHIAAFQSMDDPDTPTPSPHMTPSQQGRGPKRKITKPTLGPYIDQPTWLRYWAGARKGKKNPETNSWITPAARHNRHRTTCNWLPQVHTLRGAYSDPV